MVDTIGPMVRAGVKEDGTVEVVHVVGGCLGGAATGFVAGALGALTGFDLSRRTAWTVVVLSMLALGWDTVSDGRRFGLARQTPQAWRELLPPRVTSFLYGIDLGLGWTTRLYFTSFLVMLVAAAATSHALLGAAAGAAFGVVRAAVVVVGERRARGVLAIDTLAARRPWVRLVNGVALLQFAAASALVASAIL